MNNFYFQLSFGPLGDHRFFITPKKYYDETGFLSDTTVWTDAFPDGFDELCDSTFEYHGNPQVGYQLLVDAGFIEKKMFSEDGTSLHPPKEKK